MTQSNDTGRITTQDVERLKAATPKAKARLGRRINPYLRAVEIGPPTPVTQAHRDEIVRQLSWGALSFRGLCTMLDRSIGRVDLGTGDAASIARANAQLATPRAQRPRVDRGLTRRTLNSAVDRGEVIAVLVRRPGLSPRHRERRSYYVYAPARPEVINRAKVRRSPRPVVIARGEARFGGRS